MQSRSQCPSGSLDRPPQPHHHHHRNDQTNQTNRATYHQLPRRTRLDPRPPSAQIPAPNIRQPAPGIEHRGIRPDVANVAPEAAEPRVPGHAGQAVEVLGCGGVHGLGGRDVLVREGKLRQPEGCVGIHVAVVAEVGGEALEVAVPGGFYTC